MSTVRRRIFLVLPFVFLALLSLTMVSAKAETNIYRVFNPSTGEHLYTSDQNEATALAQSGWNDEGTGWVAPDAGNPVFRLFNPQISDHLYTTDTNEVGVLTTQQGWVADFNGQPIFYSGGSIPVYRLFMSNTGRHHLTTDENEYNVLGGQGWNQEGIKLYAVSVGSSAPQTPSSSFSYESIINDFKNNSATYPDCIPFYLQRDMDGNGVEELILGNDNLMNPVYYVYTVENGSPKILYSVANPNDLVPSDSLGITEDLTGFTVAQPGDMVYLYRVQGTNFVPTDYYHFENNKYYHTTDPNNPTQTEIGQEEYFQVIRPVQNRVDIGAHLL